MNTFNYKRLSTSVYYGSVKTASDPKISRQQQINQVTGKMSVHNETHNEIEHLTNQILQKVNNSANGERVYVVLVGAPGSGKSTIAEALKTCLLQKLAGSELLLTQSQQEEKSSNGFDKGTRSLEQVTSDIPLCAASDVPKHRLSEADLKAIENFKTFKYYGTDDDMIIESGGGIDNSIKLKVEFHSSATKAKNCINDYVSIVPMDGFHLSRKMLDKFQNFEEMHKRRGSYYTFDSKNYLELVKLITRVNKKRGTEDISIFYPGFDHALKDPQQDQHVVKPETKVVIMEGLYLLLDKPNWKSIVSSLPAENTLIYKIDSEESTMEKRVSKRHVQSGICATLEEAIERFRFNDAINGKFIEENMVPNKSIIHIKND
ncbi:hypothetical protein ACO0RG_003424 [Hanseniaspora osmophila]